MNERTILVHVDVGDETVRAGKLFMRVRRERETCSFDYDPAWLRHPKGFALDPARLPLGRGTFHAPTSLFGGLADSAPDRWGRTLMARRMRLLGPQRSLRESDYLLMVDDVARQGALRLKQSEEGPFEASGQPAIPPLLRLGDLLDAAETVQRDDGDLDALQLLFAPGSSLGGARPKASVLDPHGALSIAKFPAVNDDWPVPTWEYVAYRLAERAGITVPATSLVEVLDRRVLVSRRFDRRGQRRVAYLSAMALLGETDGEAGHSYLEIADAIRQHGAAPRQDLAQLWRRMIFHVLISNTDDHLRNHGFLRADQGWLLAPAFDLNPVPTDARPRRHVLALDETSHASSLATCLAVAGYFDLAADRARAIVREVAAATANWRTVAREQDLQPAAIERMASAFEHEDARAAAGIG